MHKGAFRNSFFAFILQGFRLFFLSTAFYHYSHTELWHISFPFWHKQKYSTLTPNNQFSLKGIFQFVPGSCVKHTSLALTLVWNSCITYKHNRQKDPCLHLVFSKFVTFKKPTLTSWLSVSAIYRFIMFCARKWPVF